MTNLMKIYFNRFMLLMLLGLSVAACHKEDSLPDSPNKGPEVITPDIDKINTTLRGKALILASNGNIIPMLQARLTELSTDISDTDLKFILMDEATAADFLADNTKYSMLRSRYNSDCAIGFVDPAANSLRLMEQLRRPLYEANLPTKVDNTLIEQFSDIHIYMMMSNGNAQATPKPDRESVSRIEVVSTTFEEDESGTETTSEYTTKAKPNLTSHLLGRAAEKIISWVNREIESADGLHPALTRSDSVDYRDESTSTYEWNDVSLTLDFSEISDAHGGVDSTFSPITVETDVKFTISAAYDEKQNKDVYDVQMSYKYPANESWMAKGDYEKHGIIYYEDMAYNYKWAGYVFIGPIINLQMKRDTTTIDNANVETWGAAPRNEAGSVVNTHVPLGVEHGYSFSCGASVGMSAGGPSAEKSRAFGFSKAYTEPADLTTTSSSEMPFEYVDKLNDIEGAYWEYNRTSYNLYDYTWGINPSLNDVPSSILISNVEQSAGVSFILSNSRDFGDSDIKLSIDMSYKLYSEACTPWDRDRFTRTVPSLNESITAPIVYRYSEKYNPGPYNSETSADDDGWMQLKSMLMQNPLYKSLDTADVLKVGARVEYVDIKVTGEDGSVTTEKVRGVDAMFDEIWADTIKSLVNQYNGTKVDAVWIIGATDAYGNWQKRGLYINGTTWQETLDIKALKEELDSK